MNKYYVLIALAALIGVVKAHPLSELYDVPEEQMTQVSFRPTDEQEVQNLSEQAKGNFESVCYEVRDLYINKVNSKLNEVAAKGLEALFKAIKEIATEMIDQQSDAVARAATNLRAGEPFERTSEEDEHPLDADGDGEVTEDELSTKLAADAYSTQEEEPPKDMGFFKRIADAIVGVLATTLNGGKSEGMMVFAQLKDQMSAETLQATVTGACNVVSTEIYREIDEVILTRKKSIMKSVEKNKSLARTTSEKQKFEEAANFARNVDMKTLGCLTTSRLSAISRFCTIANGVMPLISQMFAQRQQTV